MVSAVNSATSLFIEEELGMYYKTLITFVKETDSILLKNPNAPINRGMDAHHPPLAAPLCGL